MTAVLRILIQATLEVRVVLLAIGDGDGDFVPVVAVLGVRPGGEYLVLGAAVLPHETAQIAQPLATPELPERLLPEKESDRIVLTGWRGQRGQCVQRLVTAKQWRI